MRNLKRCIALSSILVVGVLTGCGKTEGNEPQEAWNRANKPINMGRGYKYNLSVLPLSGQIDVKPWSDTYWPSYQGGISSRWASGTPEAFTYAPPTKEAVAAMDDSQIFQLSPAEKFDIFMGRFDYPTVRSERGRVNPKNETWEGLCHGWAPAAVLFKEPNPVKMISTDGIGVTFGASDVKALLTYVTANDATSKTTFLAERCNVDLNKNPELANRTECKDTNAGSFHVVLTNQIGIMKQSFLADVTRGSEVWNHPVYAYESKILRMKLPSLGAAFGTVREAVVRTVMKFTVETQPEWGTNIFAYNQKVYEYRLELNILGQIIGGSWISAERPDFLWNKQMPTFGGYFGGVKDIWERSLTAPYPSR